MRTQCPSARSDDDDARADTQAPGLRSRVPQHPGATQPTPSRALAARRRRGHKKNPPQSNCERILGGANGTRTRNPLLAKQVRYQLRHSPIRPDQLLQPKVALANV